MNFFSKKKKEKDNQQQMQSHDKFPKKKTDNIIYHGEIRAILDNDLKPFNNEKFCAIKTNVDNFIKDKISKQEFRIFCKTKFGINEIYADSLIVEYFTINNTSCDDINNNKNHQLLNGGLYKKKSLKKRQHKIMKRTNKKKSIKKRQHKTIKITKKY